MPLLFARLTSEGSLCGEQYAAEEEQKRQELAGCCLADFEQRVTLGCALFLCLHASFARRPFPRSST